MVRVLSVLCTILKMSCEDLTLLYSTRYPVLVPDGSATLPGASVVCSSAP